MFLQFKLKLFQTQNKCLQFLSSYKYPLIILFIATLYAYYGLWKTFFFADAWQMLGSYPLIRDYGFSYFFQLFALPYGIHFVPLGIFISTVETYFFGTNAFYYGILSLILHFINVFLVYYSILRITKHRTVSLLGGAFFAVNYSIQGGVMWFASNTWIEISTTFILLGLIQFLLFYKNNKIINLFISFTFFLSAVFIKEYGFMLLIVCLFYLITSFVHQRKKKYLSLIIFYSVIIIFYVFFREFFVHSSSSLVISQFNRHSFILFVWNIFTLPVKFLSSIFLPQSWILAFSNFISQNIYSSLDISQSPVFKTVLFYDLLNIFFGLLFVVFSFIIYCKIASMITREQRLALNLYGLSFYFIPLIFLTLSDYMYWIYSRYLYLPAAIWSIFLFSSFAFIPYFKKRKYLSIIAFGLCAIFICIHAFFNHIYFTSYVKQSNYRLHAVQRVSKRLDFNKKQQIVYIKTTNGGYTNNNDIFGVGTSFGKELLVWNWYQDDNKNKLPTCLYDPLFLFKNPINDYKECDGKGYGYFQDIHLLAKTVKKYHINKNSIVALNYDENTDTFVDISSEIKKRLQAYE